MLFQALTDAPMLREGASLSFMAIPQCAGEPPQPLTVGAEVTVRLGYCSPLILQGRITAANADLARVVMTTGTQEWVLEPGIAGEPNAVPGIASEVWRVL